MLLKVFWKGLRVRVMGNENFWWAGTKKAWNHKLHATYRCHGLVVYAIANP